MGTSFSKLLRPVSYNCYELGHTWNPSCTQSSLEVGLTCFEEALKIYTSVYTVRIEIPKLFCCKMQDYYLLEVSDRVIIFCTLLFLQVFLGVEGQSSWSGGLGDLAEKHSQIFSLPILQCFLLCLGLLHFQVNMTETTYYYYYDTVDKKARNMKYYLLSCKCFDLILFVSLSFL